MAGMKPIITPIPDWQDAWQFASVRVGAGAVLIGLMAPDQLAALLDWIGIGAERTPAVLGLAFILSRVLQKAEK
jgi:hypothetical protein